MNAARLWIASLLGLALALVTTSVVITTPAMGSDAPHDRVVSGDPANWTPHALDNSIRAIEQVGDVVVAGGDFTRIATNDLGEQNSTRRRVFAFDASTGDLITASSPRSAAERSRHSQRIPTVTRSSSGGPSRISTA